MRKSTYKWLFGDDVAKSAGYQPYNLTIARGFIALLLMHVIQTACGIALALGVKFTNTQNGQAEPADIQLMGMYAVLFSGAIILLLVWFDIKSLGSPFLSQIGFQRSIIKVDRASLLIISLLASSHFFAWIYRSVVLPQFGQGGILGHASQLFAYLLETGSTLGISGFLILGLIVAPVMEEIIFRGYLQSSLAKRLPNWIAILITSIVFMLGHGPMILWPMYFVYSLAWGWIYSYTRSLKTAIILHMLSNLFYTIVVLLDWDILA